MADKVFNIAKGRQIYYATLPATNDGLRCTPLQTVQADATIVDHDTLAQVLAANTEQTTMGRKDLTSVVVTVDDTNDFAWVDCADIVWTAATGAALVALIFTYKPDLAVSDDTVQIPITKHDFTVTPNGGDITAQIATTGFVKAT